MGTITVIFVPLYALFVLISNIFGIVSGDNSAKVVLPYDPENGVVWEYDNVDDPYIRLAKTETNGNKQIFYFVDNFRHFYDIGLVELTDGDYLDLIFTDRNGNSVKYYAQIYEEGLTTFSRIKLLSPDEYIEFIYDIKPQTQFEMYSWYADIDCEEYILYNANVFAAENSYTVVYEKGYSESDTIAVEFSCRSFPQYADVDETYSLKIDFSSGEGILVYENIDIKYLNPNKR